MKLSTGRVISNEDYTKTGKFLAKVSELDNSVVEVTYTSPYFLQGFAGFIAIPEPTSLVILAQIDDELNGAKWFYLGTIVDELQGDVAKDNRLLGVQGTNDLGVLPEDHHLYKADNTPDRVTLKSPKGNSLILSDSSNSEFNNIKTELKSPSGKSIQLNDSTYIDALILRNEHGDRIKISSSSNGLSGPRSIELESKGSVKVISREGGVDLLVEDGTDINIVNNSSGAKADPSFPNTSGNINIKSSSHNINIDSPGGDINIVAGSNINITSAGVVDVQCLEFNVDSATNNFNLR